MLCCVEEGRGEEGRERKEGGRKKEWREGDEEGRRDRKWGGKLFEKAVTTGICGPCSVGQAGRAARSPSPSCVHLPPTKTMRNRDGSFLGRVLQTQSSQNTKALRLCSHGHRVVAPRLRLPSLTRAHPVGGEGGERWGRHLAELTPGGAVGPRKGRTWELPSPVRDAGHTRLSSPELRGLIRRDTVGERQRQQWLLILRRTFLAADHGISPSAPVGYRLGKSTVFRVSPGYSSLWLTKLWAVNHPAWPCPSFLDHRSEGNSR